VDAFDGVTAVSKLFDEKIDVYIHGDQYTQGRLEGNLKIVSGRAKNGSPETTGKVLKLRPSILCMPQSYTFPPSFYFSREARLAGLMVLPVARGSQ
jgi:hypothetical protein